MQAAQRGGVRASDQLCQHCGAVVDDVGPYCCIGCRAAAALMSARGLDRARALADRPLPPGGAPTARAWLPPLLGAPRITLDVQGITCGACVWVLEKLGRDLGCAVNPGVGRMELDATDVARVGAYLDDVETLGYRVGPPHKRGDAVRDGLVLRAGITAALAMTGMSFAFARYLGLDAADPSSATIAALFSAGELACATLSVAVGGTFFFASAWRALHLGVVPLDLPVAVGIALAYGGSVAAAAAGARDGVFFDSVSMFVALMVLGRLAQRGALARSRAQLLDDTGLEGLAVTRLEGRTPRQSTAAAVRAGDLLLLRPGDACPVDARLEAGASAFSLAWIDGEAEPRAFDVGDVVPAGACHAGGSAVEARALDDGARSRLAVLLSRRAASARVDDGWQRWATASVALVLALAAVGAAAWWPAGPLRALEVATALLVATCPCAIGLALPLAGELAQAALRRRGVYVRTAGFLDRLQRVRRVVLDKTGTLTLGTLRLDTVSTRALAQLPDDARDALFELVARSSHPKSRALAAALAAGALRTVDVHEEAGRGLSARIDGVRWSLTDDALWKDGALVARFTFDEELQPDARNEVAALLGRGLEIHLASGDVEPRARAVAERLGIAPAHVHAALSPDGKAALVRRLGAASVLFIGDGVNDVAAFAAAGCAGTPALERPQLPARADFYTVARGLGPLDAVFDVGVAWRRATRTALRCAGVYNAAVIALALAGVLTPLACALLMPLSSLVVVALVRLAFRAPSRRVLPHPRPRPSAAPAAILSAAQGGSA